MVGRDNGVRRICDKSPTNIRAENEFWSLGMARVLDASSLS